MPNHITNVLDISGPAESLDKFRKTVEKKEKEKDEHQDKETGEEVFVFDFNGTVPMPEELNGTTSPPSTDEDKKLQEELTKKYGAGNWYDWACKYWSTKWNAYDAQEPETDLGDFIRYRFNTAWSPPEQWIITTARLFPELTFLDRWIDEVAGREN
jgi:hypothetical protein